MHRLDLGLYSHPKEFFLGGGGGVEFEPMLTPREKSPLPKKSPEEDRTRDAVDSEPKHYQLSYSGPSIGYKVLVLTAIPVLRATASWPGYTALPLIVITVACPTTLPTTAAELVS